MSIKLNDFLITYFCSKSEPVINSRKFRVTLKVNDKEYSGLGRNKKFAKIAASKSALKALKSYKNK
jgi:dsRNA-specific ribonuclease